MAYTVDILNTKVGAENGLLSKIEIGGKIYEIKALIARQNIGTLSQGLDQVAADLAALNYVKATGQFADDAAIKSYVDAQVGSINKFDVHVMQAEEALPTASENTMYVLYLKPETDAASGAYVEYITVKNGDAYSWEAIGSTKMDVTGFVTEDALTDVLKGYVDNATLEAHEKDFNDHVASLGDLAYADQATGTVAGQTISGVKATGTSTGSITVELQSTEKAVASNGKFTPAGNVTGTVKPSGTVAVTVSTSAADATLTKGDYTPEGSVSVSLSGDSFNKITGVGSQAQFTEGTYTPASITKEDVTANYAKEGIVGAVEDETLVFTAAGIEAITATKVTAFDGGSKAADTFVPNSLPTMAEHTVSVQNASFTGTLAEDLVVTGVSYAKANANAAATFTGDTNDISAAFAGTEGDVSVSGNCHEYSVKTAEFNGAAIELNVGDITVAEKTVTVSAVSGN